MTLFYRVRPVSQYLLSLPSLTRLLEQRHELAFRIGVFLNLGPGLSGAFGGLLAAGFLNAEIGALKTWQKIFAMEGMITAFFGVVFFFILPSNPDTTRWLTEEEREIAVRRISQEHLDATHEKTSMRLVLRGLLNPFTWL
jgi:sugar phosphate permease